MCPSSRPTRSFRPITPRRHPLHRVTLWGLTSLLMGLTGAARPQADARDPAAPADAVVSDPDARALPEPIRAALARARLPASSLFAWVAPADGGPARLAHQADALVQPASLMKLVTSAAALQRLGIGFQWRTGVFIDSVPRQGELPGSLYVQGSGDPKLVSERLWLLLRQVRALGITQIRGDIVLDRSAYALPDIDPAAFDGDASKPYNARPDALLVDYKAVTLTFRPDAARGVAHVSAEPALAGWRVLESVPLSAGPCADWRDGLLADLRSPNAWRFNGRYPTACGERNWVIAHNEPARFAARAIEAQWRALGGQLQGQVRDGRVPAGLQPAFEFASPPLVEVLRDMNKYSNNLIAQHLLLALASRKPATLESARASVVELLGAVGCRPAELRLDNGSGLSREERITPQCLGRWLQWSWAQPWMPELLASLPQAGETTARRLQAVAGQAHLKTGSLANVSAVAGYLHALPAAGGAIGAAGPRQVVIAIVNMPAGQSVNGDAARDVLNSVLGWAQRTGPGAASTAGRLNEGDTGAAASGGP
ncbi:MAG: D-alanyl-D-alanine carboxypeptidase/D-alanyl-D-alanine-endopeptidase [Leptothrix sp. (in: b-proteobacteria)]